MKKISFRILDFTVRNAGKLNINERTPSALIRSIKAVQRQKKDRSSDPQTFVWLTIPPTIWLGLFTLVLAESTFESSLIPFVLALPLVGLNNICKPQSDTEHRKVIVWFVSFI